MLKFNVLNKKMLFALVVTQNSTVSTRTVLQMYLIILVITIRRYLCLVNFAFAFNTIFMKLVTNFKNLL